MSTFKMGDICYCNASKDLVKITNGFQTNLNDVTTFTPTEAIAYRVVGFGKTKAGLYPQIAYTYRAVNVEDLSLCLQDAGFFPEMYEMQPKYNAGRV